MGKWSEIAAEVQAGKPAHTALKAHPTAPLRRVDSVALGASHGKGDCPALEAQMRAEQAENRQEGCGGRY